MNFITDEAKYEALKNRDPQAEGVFIYAVKSTKIYCRPTCYSKLALRKNIIFFDTTEQAVIWGFRSCKRCKPDIPQGWNSTRELVHQTCNLIFSQSQKSPKLNMSAIITTLHISKWHLCRIFKNYTGSTPRSYFIQCQLLNNNPIESIPLPSIQTKKNKLRLKKLVNQYNLLTNEYSMEHHLPRL